MTQNEALIKYLSGEGAAKGITSGEASQWNSPVGRSIQRLSERVRELEKQGHKFDKPKEENYIRYYLKEAAK